MTKELKEQLKQDLKHCNKALKFWKRVLIHFEFYEDIMCQSEINEMIYYYKDMKKFLLKELKNERN